MPENYIDQQFMTAFQAFIIRVLDDARAKGILFVILLAFLAASCYVAYHLNQQTDALAVQLRDCSTQRAAMEVRIEFQQRDIEILKADVARLLTAATRRR